MRREVKTRMFPLTQLPLNNRPSTHPQRQAEKHTCCGAIESTEWKYTADSRHSGLRVIAQETEYECVRKTVEEIDGGGREKKHFWIQQTVSIKFRFSTNKCSLKYCICTLPQINHSVWARIVFEGVKWACKYCPPVWREPWSQIHFQNCFEYQVLC